MAHASDRVSAYLRRNLDEQWTDAEANATVLSAEIGRLDWIGRATALDWFLWQVGMRMLSESQTESVIDRDFATQRAAPEVAAFVDVAQHTLAAVLMQLDDAGPVENSSQAAIYAVSPLAVHRAGFEAWVERGDLSALGEAFRNLPGHAFLAMAANPCDNLEAMLARDGFWRGMLGRDSGF